MTKPKEPLATMPQYIAFGPRPIDSSALPAEVAAARTAAFKAIKDLYGMVRRDTCKDAAVEQLVEIGTLAATFVEGLWGSDRYKGAVEAAAAHRIDFPVLATGPGVVGYAKRVAMRGSLPLMGTSQQWAKSEGDESDLGRELQRFVMGVRNPGWLRVVDDEGERDVITPTVRHLLRESTGAAAQRTWTHAFEHYVKTYRPDLLGLNGRSGRYKALAQRSVATFGIKDPWSAFFRYVRNRMRSTLKRPRATKYQKRAQI